MFGGGRQCETRKIKQEKRLSVKRNALRKNLRNWLESRQEDKLIWLVSKQLPRIRKREGEKPKINHQSKLNGCG